MGPVPVVGAGRDDSRTALRSAPKNAPIAAASRRSWPTSCGRVATHEDLMAAIEAGEVRGVWVSGGYKVAWIDAATAGRFDGLELLVVQDMFSSPLVGSGDVPIARRGLCRTRRLLRQPCRPAANASSGPSGRWPACGSRGAFTGSCSGEPGCTRPAACWTKWPARSAILPPPASRCPPVGVDLKVNLLAVVGRAVTQASDGLNAEIRTPEVEALIGLNHCLLKTPTATFDSACRPTSSLIAVLTVPLVKIALLIGALMTAAAYLVLLERLDRRLGAGPARAQPRRIRSGLLQPLADGLKFIFKEEYTPAHVDKFLFILAPIIDPGRGPGDLCRDSVRQRAAAAWTSRASSRSDRAGRGAGRRRRHDLRLCAAAASPSTA